MLGSKLWSYTEREEGIQVQTGIQKYWGKKEFLVFNFVSKDHYANSFLVSQVFPYLFKVINKQVIFNNPDLIENKSHELPSKEELLEAGLDNIIKVLNKLREENFSPRTIAMFEEVLGIYVRKRFLSFPSQEKNWLMYPTNPREEEPILPSPAKIGNVYNMTQEEVIKKVLLLWALIKTLLK